MKIRISDLSFVGAMLLIFFASFLSPIQALFDGKIIFFIYIIIFICIAVGGLYEKIVIKNKIWFYVWLIFLFCFLFKNYDLLHFRITAESFIRPFVSLLAMGILSTQAKWYLKVPKWIAVTSYIHVIATIFFFIFPSFWTVYSNFVYKGQIIPGTLNGNGYTAALNGHYSTNAVLVSLAILICVAYAFTSKKINKRIFAFAAFIALMLTTKRAHFIFVILSCIIIYMVLNWKKNYIFTILKIGGAIILGVIIIAILSKYITAIEDLLNRLNSVLTDNSTLERIQMWKYAWKMFLDKPLFGYGWGSFQHQAQFLGVSSTLLNVHNVYLQLLAENGIIGFLIFLCLSIWSLKRILKVLYHRSRYDISIAQFNVLIVSSMLQIFLLMYGFTGNFLYDFCVIYYAIAVAAGNAVVNLVKRK